MTLYGVVFLQLGITRYIIETIISNLNGFVVGIIHLITGNRGRRFTPYATL